MSIVIPSYQRRRDITRLISHIKKLSDELPAPWEGVDVVVVLDGSTDGSEEALREIELAIPLLVICQKNAGRSAARNAGLRAAKGKVIWFLDDDLLPIAGTLERHRQVHEAHDDLMLLGPSKVAPGIELFDASRRFWAEHDELRGQGEVVERFDLMAVANSSVRASRLRSVGGFDEHFVGYGFEDNELVLRLQKSGTVVRFDGAAACWHFTSVGEKEDRLRRRELGRNAVRFIRLHPEVARHYFPDQYPNRAMRILDKAGITSPTLLAGLSMLAAISVTLTRHMIGRGEILWMLSRDASYAAGIADLDRSLLPRILGRPNAKTDDGGALQ